MRGIGCAAAALVLAVAGCAGSPAEVPGAEHNQGTGEPVQLARFSGVSSHWSGLQQRERLVVESRDEWERVWHALHANGSPMPALPEVDFGRDAVVVAAMGSRPTGGYGISVAGATRQAGHTLLQVVETSPSARCGTTQAVTSPVDVVRLSRSALPLRFAEQQAVLDC